MQADLLALAEYCWPLRGLIASVFHKIIANFSRQTVDYDSFRSSISVRLVCVSVFVAFDQIGAKHIVSLVVARRPNEFRGDLKHMGVHKRLC